MKKRSERNFLPPDPHDVGSATILLPVTAAALDALRYIGEAPPKRVYSFALPDRESEECLSRVAESYLENHLERTFESLRFFHTLVRKS